MVDMANVLAEMIARDVKPDGTIDTAPIKAAFEAVEQRRFEAKIYSHTKTEVNMDAYVTDKHGRVLYDSLHPQFIGTVSTNRDVNLTITGRYGARSTRDDQRDPNSSIMYVAAPIRAHGAFAGVVSVAKPQHSTFKFRDETKAWLIRTIGSLVLCMVLGSFLLARWTTRPIRRLTGYAESITRGERPPVPKLHGIEMKTLGTAFEKMRDTLENRESVEHYVQTLTHELKSPVAAIRGAAELMQEETMPEAQRGRFLRNIQGESLRLQDLLDRLLSLAALENKKALEEPAKVDLSAIAREVCDHLTAPLAQRGLKLDCWVQDGVQAKGDAFLLQLAFTNLAQNAVDFSPDGGVVSIGLKTVDDRACFIVEDEGPGLPEYARGRVFERFYSLPRPHNGKKSSGLGLCFVKETAALHQGSVELENREGGKGARAVFSMPV